MSKKKAVVVYDPRKLKSEQRVFIDNHNGRPEDVCFDFAEKFGFKITRRLVRQARKIQRQQAAA